MRRSLLIGAVLASLGCGHATALPILDFLRMNLDDEASYTAALVEGSAKWLRQQGHPDQAQQAIALFKDSGPHGGVVRLANNVKQDITINNRNSTNPNNRTVPLELEDAMARTLKDVGITVPVPYLMSINRNFKPGILRR